MLSLKKLKPYIFSGGILISLIFNFALLTFNFASAQGLTSPDVAGTGLSTQSLENTIINIINAALALAGIIALAVIIYGGYVWMTSGGIPQRIVLAKKILLSAVIGLIIILPSWAIVNYSKSGARGGGGGGGGGSCSEGTESGCYDCSGGSWVPDNNNAGCGFGDLFTVKWVDPKNGDANIPLCRIIQAGFSKNVNTTTVNSSNVIIQMRCTDDSECQNVLGGNNLGTCSVLYIDGLYCSDNIAALPGVQWNYFDALSDIDSLPDAFEFIPPAEWEKERTYRINMTSGVKSASDAALSIEFLSTFSTGSLTDNTAPIVTSIVPDPANNTYICRMKPISAEFK